MTKFFAKTLTVFLTVFAFNLFFTAQASADAGDLDTSFNVGTGANAVVYTSSLQSDGKLFIAGDFTSINGNPLNRMARLNSDGSLDTTFNIGTGANAYVFSSLIQSDGKIIIGGSFSAINGTPRSRIARLNADGSLDTTFNVGTGVNDYVYNIYQQPDEKIIIVGYFASYNGTPRSRIARLNADGSLDTTFDPGLGANGATSTERLISHIEFQPDGKIVIGGAFTSYNGTLVNRIARINSDGSLDTTFSIGTGFANGAATTNIRGIHFVDNKLIVVGRFITYNDQAVRNIVRLNLDGSLDTTFNVGTGSSAEIFRLLPLSDGKLLISGSFSSYNGVARTRIARLNSDGSLDTSFNPGVGLNNTNFKFALQPDNKVIVVGIFSMYNGITVNRTARIETITNPPVTPTTSPDLDTLTDSGTSNTDNTTNDTTPDFQVQCSRAGYTITLYANGISSGTHTCAGIGMETVSITSALSQGVYSITYTETNDGGESGQSPVLLINVDLTVAPTDIISAKTDLTGTAEAGATVLVTTESGATCTTTALPDGTWSCTLAPEPIPGEDATLVTTDAAGNSTTLDFNIYKASGGSVVNYVCKDPKATNYESFGRHKPSLCKYSSTTTTPVTTPTTDNPFGGEQCPSNQLITDNMKNGDTNGVYSSYNKGKVTQISILQAHINRLLKDEYTQAAGPVDDFYRSKTKQGVERIQRKLNQLLPTMKPLVIDGIVGPFTKKAINMSC
jgi:uncharacterized delta-60 repeat protein